MAAPVGGFKAAVLAVDGIEVAEFDLPVFNKKLIVQLLNKPESESRRKVVTSASLSGRL